MNVSTLAFATLLLQVPETQSRPDEKLERLLGEVTAAARGIKAMKAKFTVRDHLATTRTEWVDSEVSVRLKRPFLARIDCDNPAGIHGWRPATVAADGLRLWILHRNPEGMSYSEGPVDDQGRGIAATNLLLVDFYCDPRRERLLRGGRATLRMLGERTVDGVTYQVLEAAMPGKLSWRCELFIDRGGLIRRAVEEFDSLVTSFGPEGKKQAIAKRRTETVLAEIAVDVPFRPADFDWQPPEGATPLDKSARSAASTLLDVGEEAPDLELPLRAGGTVSLRQQLRGRKAALLLFWHCGSPGSLGMLPFLEKLQADTKAKGLMVLAVNLRDTRKTIDHFLADKANALDIAVAEEVEKDLALRRAFGIPGYPTAYLVDSTGKVVFRAFGGNEEEILAALGKLGLR